MKLNPNSDTKLRLESLSLSMIFIMMMWPGALLLAQEDDSEDQLVLEEVIVTATRRGELLQDIPISVSAITKQKIELEGIRTFEDYGVRVPNLSFSASSNSNATNSLNISIRGVAGGTTTGFYIDDTPLPQGLNPRVLDIERIEVLRGPQGTLFGARSMGGTVRMITSQPDPVAFSGVAHAAIGAITDGKTSYLGDVMLNIPFSDDHAMRLTAYAQKIGGFIDIEPADSSNNPYIAGDPSVPLLTETLKDTNGYDVKGFQLAGRFVFADQRLVITPRIMYEKTNYDGRTQADETATRDIDGRVNGRLFDLPEPAEDKWWLGTLTIGYDADFGDFISSSSWFDRDTADTEDASMADAAGVLTGIPGQPLLPLLGFPQWSVSPSFITFSSTADIFTQEFRFTSGWDGPLQLTAGLFYQKIDAYFEFPPTALPPVPIEAIDLFSQTADQTIKEKAVFAELTYSFTDSFRLILGGRYFDNKVSVTSFQGGSFGSGLTLSESQAEDGTTWRFGLQYDINENQMLYATASEGFRIGGANTLPITVCEEDIIDAGLDPDDISFYDSDDLTSYELGYKSTLADGRVRFNAALFHIDWKDIQQGVSFPCAFGAGINAGKAEIDGGEVELEWLLTEGLSLALGAGYNDSEIVDNNGLDQLLPVGSSIQNVPKWTFNTALDWRFNVSELPMFTYLSYTYVGDSEGRGQFGVDPKRESYNLVNLRIGAEFENYTLALFVENLTDETADFGNKPPLAIDVPEIKRITVNTPRTFWLDFRYRF
jgi:iron complex outermembrane receptor protein